MWEYILTTTYQILFPVKKAFVVSQIMIAEFGSDVSVTRTTITKVGV